MEKVDADIYVTIDGDGTYPAVEVHKLLEPVVQGRADMVVGSRLSLSEDGAFRSLHVLGNSGFTYLLNKLFKANFVDILSGYRVLSRNFVERIPLITGGFQTETEMTIQAVEKKMKVIEIPIHYKARPDGSHSKLNTFKDGWLILLTIAMYMRDNNPLRFFMIISFFWIFFGEILLGFNLIFSLDSMEKVIVQGVIFLGALGLTLVGMIMSAVNTRFRETEITMRKLIKKWR